MSLKHVVRPWPMTSSLISGTEPLFYNRTFTVYGARPRPEPPGLLITLTGAYLAGTHKGGVRTEPKKPTSCLVPADPEVQWPLRTSEFNYQQALAYPILRDTDGELTTIWFSPLYPERLGQAKSSAEMLRLVLKVLQKTLLHSPRQS